jgi:hypothetical protein
MGNPQLLDLARRPVMSELILEALPDIAAGKVVDMSRVYLYAVRRKMERDALIWCSGTGREGFRPLAL